MQLELKPLPELDDPADDLDRNATSEIFIVTPDGALQHTGFYVWNSEQKWATYAPLKLYWCTTTDGNEDWFVVAHTLTQAALQHAHAEGYDDDDASAELITTLPDELQAHGEDLLGWPDHDVLRACGATFVREETPRVVQLAGRTFPERMSSTKSAKWTMIASKPPIKAGPTAHAVRPRRKPLQRRAARHRG